MAARRAEVAEGRPRHIARALDVADVAHGDVQISGDLARDHRPLDALGLEPEVRELRNEVHGGHAPQVREEDALDDAALREPGGQRIEGGLGKLGALDATQGVVIGEQVEVREGLEIGLGAAALEPEGVGLDAVQERGGQTLADLDVGGPEVLHENGRGRSVGRPDVADVRPHELRAVAARAVEVRLATCGQVVDDHDLVASGEQGVDEVAADEPGSAGDERSHACQRIEAAS